MNLRRIPLLAGLVAAAAACSAAAPRGEPVGRSTAASLGTPGVPNAPDTSCNVDLRDVKVATTARGAKKKNCVPGDGGQTCWVELTGHVDVSAEGADEGDTPYVTWQSGSDPTWYTAPMVPAPGAGTGFVRYVFTLDHDTGVAGKPLPTIQLITYLQTVVGTRLWDHNASVNNWVLDAANGWSIGYDGDYCYEPPPPAVGTLDFEPDWTDAMTGKLVAGGKLDVTYALSRMPQCEGLTTDGVEAWATTAYAWFLPGGQQTSAAVNGPYDAATKQWTTLLFERDIPAGTTQVQLWFETSGDGCTTGWDSRYGQNYVYSVSP